MANSMLQSVGIGGLPALNPSVGFSPTSNKQPLLLAERRYLSEFELANRWGMSPKTLTRWRGLGKGPVFAKFSKKVAYPLDGEGGVLDFEQHHLYVSTSERAMA